MSLEQDDISYYHATIYRLGPALERELTEENEIKGWESLIWTSNYYEPDSFQFTASKVCGAEIRAQLCDNYQFILIVANGCTGGHTGYISTIEHGEDSITFSGYGIEGILKKRIFPGWLQFQEPEFWTAMLRSKINLNEVIHYENDEGNGKRVSDFINTFEFDVIWPDMTFPQCTFAELDPSLFNGTLENFVRTLCDQGYPDEYDDQGNLITDPDLADAKFVYYALSSPGQVIFYTQPDLFITGGISGTLSVKKAEVTDVSWSFSEDDCSNLIYVSIDPNFSVNVMAPQYTYDKNGKPVMVVDDDGNPITVEQTVTVDDLETSLLPYWSFFGGVDLDAGITGQPRAIPMLTATNEQLVYITPVISVGTKRIDLGPAKKPIKTNVAVGTSEVKNGGAFKYVPIYEYQNTFSINKEQTEALAKRKAREVSSSGSNTLTCNLNPYCQSMKADNCRRVILGMFCNVIDEINMVSFTKRVTSIQESWDSNGYRCVPTFGEDFKSIYDYINYDAHGKRVK